MLCLGHIRPLFTHHVHRVLNATIRNHRKDRCVNNTQLRDTIDLKLRVDDALVNVFRETHSSAGMEGSLATDDNVAGCAASDDDKVKVRAVS